MAETTTVKLPPKVEVQKPSERPQSQTRFEQPAPIGRVEQSIADLIIAEEQNPDKAISSILEASPEQTIDSTEAQEQFGQQWRELSDEVYTAINTTRGADYSVREQLEQTMVNSLGSHRELITHALAKDEFAEEAMRMLLDASRDFSSQESVGIEVISQIKGNLSSLEGYLHSDKLGKAGESLSNLAFKTIMKGSENLGPEAMEWGLEVMYRNYDAIENRFKNNSHNAVLMLGQLMGREKILSDYYGYEHTYSDRAEKTLRELVLGNDPSNIDIDKTVGLINTLFNQSRREGVSNDWQSLLTPILERYGLDSEKIISAWGSSKRENMAVEVIRENMDRIRELEQVKPGLAASLSKEFGIKHFLRYPKEVLIRQYEEFEKNDKPYGVVLAADSDHNDAFYGTEGFWTKLQADLQGQYYLRIFEVGGLYDIGRSLVKLDRKFGQEHKISFAVLAGHGEQNNIKLGNSLRGSLDQRDLSKPGIQRVGKFFVEHPSITFLSCSTGAEQGIAQALSETIQAKVVAPRIPARIESVETKINNEGVEILPEFVQGGYFGPQEQDIIRIYDRGKLISVTEEEKAA